MSKKRKANPQIKAIIDEWDPVGLLCSFNCPEDEYETEVQMIEVVLTATKDVVILAICIHQIFIKLWSAHTFCCSIVDCIPIAQKILDSVNEK